MDYMYKKCTCTGQTKSKHCLLKKTCQLAMPTMDEVAKKLRMKYDHSVYSVIFPSSAYLHVLVVDRKNNRKVSPGRMMYFSRSPDYCKANPDYNIIGIARRECTLHDNSNSPQHCNNLCCDNGYEAYTFRRGKPCQCRFIWCCRAECNVCYEHVMKHRCK